MSSLILTCNNKLFDDYQDSSDLCRILGKTFRGNGEIMMYLSELKQKINEINVSGEDFKIVTRNRVGKEGRITFGKDPVTGKDDIKYVERDGVEISYDEEKAILYIDS